MNASRFAGDRTATWLSHQPFFRARFRAEKKHPTYSCPHSPEFALPFVYRLLPAMSIEYHVYGNTGSGDPIDYSLPLATLSGLSWNSGSLTFPGTWSFNVRAYDTVSGLEEQNLDCAISIILDSSGNDITHWPTSADGYSGVRHSCWFNPASSGTIRRQPA